VEVRRSIGAASSFIQEPVAIGSTQFVQEQMMGAQVSTMAWGQRTSFAGAGQAMELRTIAPGGFAAAPAAPLRMSVFAAHGLRDADWLPGGGKSDPYAVVEVIGKPETRFETEVVNSSCDPVWNVVADVPGYEPGDNIVVTIYDKDPMKSDDKLGEVVITSEQLAGGIEGDFALEQAGNDNATVTLRVEPPMAAAVSTMVQGGASSVVATPLASMQVPAGVMVQRPVVTTAAPQYVMSPQPQTVTTVQPQPQVVTTAQPQFVTTAQPQAHVVTTAQPQRYTGSAIVPAAAPQVVSAVTPVTTGQPFVTTAAPQYVQAPTFLAEPVAGFPVGTQAVAIPQAVGTFTSIPGQAARTITVANPGMPGTTVMMPQAMPVVTGGVFAGGVQLQGGMLKAGSITDDVFNMVDRNQDGVISRSEFRGALKGNIIAASQTTQQTIRGR